MAFRDATHFREGRHLFQHGQHLQDVSKRCFGGIQCCFPYLPAAPSEPICAPGFNHHRLLTAFLQEECWCLDVGGVWTLLRNSRPGFWACGDFTLNVGVKSLCGGKIYILSPDSRLLTPTSASKSCMKETELASPLISAGHQRLRSVSVVFPDQRAR